MKRLKYLLEKEFKQFIRNPFLIRVLVIMPIAVIALLPQVTQMDSHNINIGIVDKDNTAMSKRLVDKISESSYFIFQGKYSDYKYAMEDIERGNIDIILEIPKDLEKDFIRFGTPVINISANAVNSMKSGLGSNYLVNTINDFAQEERRGSGVNAVNPDKLISIQNRYNSYLNYKFFMIPALTVMLIIVFCGYLAVLSIIGEKEKGTIEQINVSPVSRLEFVVAKLVPYWMFGLVVITISLVLGYFIYGLFPVGNIFLLYLGAILFIFVMSGIGLFISNFSNTMQQAIFMMFFFTVVFILMSGLFTPVASMPSWAKAITTVIPPKYFINIMRDVYLKGSGFLDGWINYMALFIFAVIINAGAALSYKKQE